MVLPNHRSIQAQYVASQYIDSVKGHHAPLGTASHWMRAMKQDEGKEGLPPDSKHCRRNASAALTAARGAFMRDSGITVSPTFQRRLFPDHDVGAGCCMQSTCGSPGNHGVTLQ